MTCKLEINFPILPEFGFIELSRESLDQVTKDYMGIWNRALELYEVEKWAYYNQKRKITVKQ